MGAEARPETSAVPGSATRRVAASLIAAFALTAQVGLAEGARKSLSCTVVRLCDAAGACEAASGSVVFRLEPREVQAGGVGHYVVEYDGTRADVDARSDVGPFLWAAGDERHALLASSETEWLWHRLALSPTPTASVRFLSCTFQQ